MTKDEIRAVIVRRLGDIAPGAELDGLSETADLRDALDLDSMDQLSLLGGIEKELHVTVPPADVSRLRSLRDCVTYVAGRLGVG